MIKTGRAPTTMLFRGDLYDTASLVGLANMGITVGMIGFIGELTEESKAYCDFLSKWLRSNGLPEITIHPSFLNENLAHIIDRPHRDWGWSEKECIAALRLSQIPLPSTYTTTFNEKRKI